MNDRQHLERARLVFVSYGIDTTEIDRRLARINRPIPRIRHSNNDPAHYGR